MMSYRDPAQGIGEPANELASNIESLLAPIDARLESGEWSDDHVTELMILLSELTELKYKLLQLARKNW